MKPHELAHHKDDIQRQAIELFKLKESMFKEDPPFARWRACIRLVADAFLKLGPQAYKSGPTIILPPPFTLA